MRKSEPDKFSFSCSPSDGIYLFLGKKKCLHCGNKLIKEKKSVVNVWTKRRTHRSTGMRVKDIYYEFLCTKCGYVRKIGDTSVNR